MTVSNGTLKEHAALMALDVARQIWNEKPAFPIARAKELVSRLGNVSIEDLVGPHKFQPHTSYRQAAMVAAYLCADKSLPTVARSFRRDHTTLVYAFRVLMPILGAPSYAAAAHLWFHALMAKEARAAA